jgi:hypothetical protein
MTSSLKDFSRGVTFKIKRQVNIHLLFFFLILNWGEGKSLIDVYELKNYFN